MTDDFDDDSEPAAILTAYHRKVAQHRKATGVSWPLVRENCVRPDKTITDTSVYEPTVVARWARRSDGGYRIELL